MPRWHNRWFLSAALVAGALPVVWLSRDPGRRGSARLPPEDWDIARLVAHLEQKGLNLRAVSTQKEGGSHPQAFLTTADVGWQDLNRLRKDPREIETWRGIVYCQWQSHRGSAIDLDSLWEDCYFIAGPFLFFGDRQLLEQVRAALPSP